MQWTLLPSTNVKVVAVGRSAPLHGYSVFVTDTISENTLNIGQYRFGKSGVLLFQGKAISSELGINVGIADKSMCKLKTYINRF